MNDLGIIFLTYKRTAYALETIRGIDQHLKYSLGSALWYVADDGSEPDHVGAIVRELDWRGHTLAEIRSNRHGYGANINWAKRRAGSRCAAFLVLEDDWYLTEPMDIDPYVRLLVEKPDHVSFVRLGHLPIQLDLESVGHDGRMYLDVKKSRQYAFSGNPHLTTPYAVACYGEYPTGKNPGETELAYDAQIRQKSGPAILWPLAIGDRFLFAHIGGEKSYEVD
jgi:hypothetical protein